MPIPKAQVATTHSRRPSRKAECVASRRLIWASTTPVPTNPPPQPGKNPAGGDNCTLVPGRLETDVLRYNAAAARVVAAAAGAEDADDDADAADAAGIVFAAGKAASQVAGVCDLHAVIEARCGQGYRECDIAQCGGPHFQPEGFRMLGEALARCVLTGH